MDECFAVSQIELQRGGWCIILRLTEPGKLETYTPELIEVEFSGTGFGNKTIGSICERIGLDTTVATQRLSSAGITTNLNQTMRAAAEEADTEAIEIMKLLIINGYKLPFDEIKAVM